MRKIRKSLIFRSCLGIAILGALQTHRDVAHFVAMAIVQAMIAGIA